MTRVEYWDTGNGKLSADTGLQMLEGVVKWDSFRAAAWNRTFIALWQIQLWDTNEKLALQFSCSSSLLLNQEEDYLLHLHTASHRTYLQKWSQTQLCPGHSHCLHQEYAWLDWDCSLKSHIISQTAIYDIITELWAHLNFCISNQLAWSVPFYTAIKY